MGWYTIVFAISLILLYVVSAGRREILIDTTQELWMSKENFHDLIWASYTIPQCVNIFASDETAETERLFNGFISIYPFEYILNGTVDGCDSYFFVAASEEKLLNDLESAITVNANVEILIIVDDDVEEPTGIDDDDRPNLFDVSMYLNTNVNIAARNGLWTLSENFLFPREFKKVSSYNEMVHKRGIVDLQGEELHASTFYNPPLCYLETTVNRTVDGIEAEFFTLKDEDENDGVELILFKLIAERLNFTYTIRKPGGNIRYGNPNGSVWEGGVLGQLFRDETHIGFGGLWLVLESYQFAYMTIPWTPLHLNFLVPRPKPHASFWALTTPLSSKVWAAIGAMLIAQSVCVYARAWVNPRIPKRFRSFTKTWTEMMARMVGTWAPRKNQCLELEFQLWHFIGVLMVTAYSSSLAAKLANRDYDKRIDTLQDFIAANLTWGIETPPSSFHHFVDLSDPYAVQFVNRFEQETSEAERHEKILEGNYAIFGRLLSEAFFPTESVSNEDLKNYRLMRDSISEYYISFAVNPWLGDSVDVLMLWMQETGLVQHTINDVLYRRMSIALFEVLDEQDVNNGEARVLELTPLGAGFSLYFVGLFISTIVFCLELRSAQGSRSIREVLLDIRKNREIWQAKEVKRKCVHTMFMKLKRKRYGFDRSRKNEWMEDIGRPRRFKMEIMYIP